MCRPNGKDNSLFYKNNENNPNSKNEWTYAVSLFFFQNKPDFIKKKKKKKT